MNRVDGITLEVMRNALQSAAEEMGAVLVRTAYSVNIKDRRDCSSCIYTEAGDLVAQAEHIPLHLGIMPFVIRNILQVYPLDQLKDGDSILVNDPYVNGSHLPDCILVTPVFHEGRIAALVANLAHHADVGGMVPGSLPTNATEIFQEGIRIRPCRIVKQGEVDEELMRLISDNTRLPDEWRGDLEAQLACNLVGRRRILEMIRAHGPEMVRAYMQEIIEYSYRRTLQKIRLLPRGEFSFTDYLETGTTPEEQLPVTVTIRVEEDRMVFDFTGTGPQAPNSLNATEGVTCACVYFVSKVMLDPQIPANAGAYRPLEVILPEGTVVNPRYPAAVSTANTNTSQRIVDVLFGAFGKILPDQAVAASGGSMSGFILGGTDPRTGGYYTYVETYGCGSGASAKRQGVDGLQTNMTNTRNTPVEIMENQYPLEVLEYAIVPGTGGRGIHRGGNALRRKVKILAPQASVTIITAREFSRPYGICGGEDGANSYCAVIHDGIETKQHALFTGTVSQGDVVILQTAGGGGYGAPQE